jgi:hypothetical protein
MPPTNYAPRPSNESSASTRRDPFTPVTWPELDSDLSGDAFQLLARIRRIADRDLTDGFIGARTLKALAVLHGVSARKLRNAITE